MRRLSTLPAACCLAGSTPLWAQAGGTDQRSADKQRRGKAVATVAERPLSELAPCGTGPQGGQQAHIGARGPPSNAERSAHAEAHVGRAWAAFVTAMNHTDTRRSKHGPFQCVRTHVCIVRDPPDARIGARAPRAESQGGGGGWGMIMAHCNYEARHSVCGAARSLR